MRILVLITCLYLLGCKSEPNTDFNLFLNNFEEMVIEKNSLIKFDNPELFDKGKIEMTDKDIYDYICPILNYCKYQTIGTSGIQFYYGYILSKTSDYVTICYYSHILPFKETITLVKYDLEGRIIGSLVLYERGQDYLISSSLDGTTNIVETIKLFSFKNIQKPLADGIFNLEKHIQKIEIGNENKFELISETINKYRAKLVGEEWVYPVNLEGEEIKSSNKIR